MKELSLDYVVAAETAFFSEDQRLSIIRIFKEIKVEKDKIEHDSTVYPFFSIAGKVTGDYGEGVIVGVIHDNGEAMINEVMVKAGEKNKSFLNFIVNVSTIPLKIGTYFVVVKDEKGELIEKNGLFDVVEFK
ncbi:hypothetical protein K9M47_02805 [Candidatus Gracilibacteria bacterium]|nr:hypothetical protein [Candidatus Gracilibacteria bacterium]MCF7898590.1 hypothetical protein [Candidatus Paceibacterota bacterium]